MIEIINTLNHTSPIRTIFYAIIFIVVIFMISHCIISVVELIFNSFKIKIKKENDSKDS